MTLYIIFDNNNNNKYIYMQQYLTFLGLINLFNQVCVCVCVTFFSFRNDVKGCCSLTKCNVPLAVDSCLV